MKWLLLAIALLGSGCAMVQPFQKEELGKPYMKFKQAAPGTFFVEHTVITVEQAEGGNGKAGGGCGCR